jgi:hypothetical protein
VFTADAEREEEEQLVLRKQDLLVPLPVRQHRERAIGARKWTDLNVGKLAAIICSSNS